MNDEVKGEGESRVPRPEPQAEELARVRKELRFTRGVLTLVRQQHRDLRRRGRQPDGWGGWLLVLAFLMGFTLAFFAELLRELFWRWTAPPPPPYPVPACAAPANLVPCPVPFPPPDPEPAEEDRAT